MASHIRTTWIDVPAEIREAMHAVLVHSKLNNRRTDDGPPFLNTYYKMFKKPPYYQVTYTPKETNEQVALGVSRDRMVAGLLGRVVYIDCRLLMHHGPTVWLHSMMKDPRKAKEWVLAMQEEFLRVHNAPYSDPPRPPFAFSPLIGTLPSLAHLDVADATHLLSEDPVMFRHGLLSYQSRVLDLFSNEQRARMHEQLVAKVRNNKAFKKRVFAHLIDQLHFEPCGGGSVRDDFYGVVDVPETCLGDPFDGLNYFALASLLYTFFLEPYYVLAGNGLKHCQHVLRERQKSFDAYADALRNDHEIYMRALFERAGGGDVYAPPTYRALSTMKGRHVFSYAKHQC